jgi:hypothetical protein
LTLRPILSELITARNSPVFTGFSGVHALITVINALWRGSSGHFWRDFVPRGKVGDLRKYRLLALAEIAVGTTNPLKPVVNCVVVNRPQIAAGHAEEGVFSPGALQDERARRLREIVERSGGPAFRNKVIAAYGSRCAVTGCDAVAALEAAHSVPYCGPQSNHVSNGLLLRSDIHTLFDLDLIGIDPKTMAVAVATLLSKTTYRELQGNEIRVPKVVSKRPNAQALRKRWELFSRHERMCKAPKQ